jgi:hypothetical protein
MNPLKRTAGVFMILASACCLLFGIYLFLVRADVFALAYVAGGCAGLGFSLATYNRGTAIKDLNPDLEIIDIQFGGEGVKEKNPPLPLWLNVLGAVSFLGGLSLSGYVAYGLAMFMDESTLSHPSDYFILFLLGIFFFGGVGTVYYCSDFLFNRRREH